MDLNGIREAKNKIPFEPFSLRLADGRELHVPHGDFLAFMKRRFIAINPNDDSWSVVEPLLVVSIEYGNNPAGNKNGAGG